ncbi:MAG: Crp/Fnr family transcriptional regulator [Eubacteriales bacterium]|nr:Crp/Fnr family transcriptional regulator [Eubacteriales bacterium]
MEQERLDKALPFLKSLEAKRRNQFEEYFRSAPQWLLDSFQVLKMEKDTVFIKENTPVDTIYFVGKGMVKAVDYRIYGIAFDFMQFDGVYAFGGMEVIMDEPLYRTTLQTVTPCIMVKIPKKTYAKWLDTDIRALKIEAKNVACYLLEEGRNDRAYLFLQGADRLALFLVDTYLKYQVNGVLLVNSTRQELADSSGLCVKTVNRAVKKFEENGWITRKGSKFTMNQEQYGKMNAMVSKLIER